MIATIVFEFLGVSALKFGRRLPDKTLATINRCIYCGAQGETLSKEHIIPRSLGGNLVLKKASCSKCSKITSKSETKIAEIAYKILRGASGYPTRRPQNVPKELAFKVAGVGNWKNIKVPLSAAPINLVRPNYSPPPFLKYAPLKDSDAHTIDILKYPNPDEYLKRQRKIFDRLRALDNKSPSRSFTIPTMGFEIGTFERVIIKIGIGLFWAANKEFAEKNAVGAALHWPSEELYIQEAGFHGMIPKNVYSIASTDPLEDEIYSASVFSMNEEEGTRHYAAIRLFPHIVFPTYLFRSEVVNGGRFAAVYKSSENLD